MRGYGRPAGTIGACGAGGRSSCLSGGKTDILFALGKLDDKAGRFDAAFRHFGAANALLRSEQSRAGIRFDRAKLTRDVDKIIAAFPRQSFALRTGWGEPSEVPVFIVGMPRAGSTLFEQIAASHSHVFGAGEQEGIGEAAAALGWEPSGWDTGKIKARAGDYLLKLRGIGGEAARVIDKMPDNIFQLGLIATLFPRARIVFCDRDCRDVALSCYFQRFSQPLGYDTDLEDCVFRIKEIRRLTAHWQEHLPLKKMTLSYETLLQEPETQARRLIEFLGLDWEPDCLNFHQTERVVRTASWAQVRKPFYQSSNGRWQNYANYYPISAGNSV